MRATESVLPPAANGTISLIGRLGHVSCAGSGDVAATIARTASSSCLILSPGCPKIGPRASELPRHRFAIVMLGASFATLSSRGPRRPQQRLVPMPNIGVLDTRFRAALDRMAAAGRLTAYTAPVDPHLEVAAIMKQHDGGPALAFTAVDGYAMPVIGNLLS